MPKLDNDPRLYSAIQDFSDADINIDPSERPILQRNELRIGNLVYLRNSICYVRELHDEKVFVSENIEHIGELYGSLVNYTSLEPIDLSNILNEDLLDHLLFEEVPFNEEEKKNTRSGRVQLKRFKCQLNSDINNLSRINLEIILPFKNIFLSIDNIDCKTGSVTEVGRIQCEEVKYLHQLQNLYFNICGKEINLSSNKIN